MAESIIVHVHGAAGTEVFSFLSRRCESTQDPAIYCYPTNAFYVLLITNYTDFDSEYEPEEKARVESLLSGRPSFSLTIELRRSNQNAACDAATDLITALGRAYKIVVDDCYRLWTSDEIAAGGDFLRVYRHEEKA